MYLVHHCQSVQGIYSNILFAPPTQYMSGICDWTSAGTGVLVYTCTYGLGLCNK